MLADVGGQGCEDRTNLFHAVDKCVMDIVESLLTSDRVLLLQRNVSQRLILVCRLEETHRMLVNSSIGQ